MAGPLTYEESQDINAHIHDLAQNPDPLAAFNAIMDVWAGHPGLFEAMHVPNPETGITLRNPGPDATRMAEKYQRKVANAAGDYVTGVQNPKRDFKQAALAANGKWKSRTQEAIARDGFAKAMNAVDSGAAVALAVSDGGAAYTAGAAKRQAKVQAAYQKLAPALGAVSQAIQAMPQNTDAERAQRLLKSRELMLAIKSRQ
jgi:hypothetical protein